MALFDKKSKSTGGPVVPPFEPQKGQTPKTPSKEGHPKGQNDLNPTREITPLPPVLFGLAEGPGQTVALRNVGPLQGPTEKW